MLTNESGTNQNVASILGSAAALPPTVIIHHRRTAVASPSRPVSIPLPVGPAPRPVAWVDGGTSAAIRASRGHHGFNGVDSSVVNLRPEGADESRAGGRFAPSRGASQVGDEPPGQENSTQLASDTPQGRTPRRAARPP